MLDGHINAGCSDWDNYIPTSMNTSGNCLGLLIEIICISCISYMEVMLTPQDSVETQII